MLELPLIIAAFIAGILTFVAPCTLPLIPGYLAFIGGTSLRDLSDPKKKKRAKRKIIINSLFYVAGFSVVFVALGSLAGFIGGALTPWRMWLTRIGGALVILFGLFMMGIFKLPFLEKGLQFSAKTKFKTGTPTNSLILGASFGFGWTPCIGPVLGSILTLASTSTTVGQGAFLLSIFSLGLGLPFVLIAFGIGSASSVIKKITGYLNIVSIVGGVFLVVMGLLLLTNNMALLISYGFEIFDFINYEALLRLL